MSTCPQCGAPVPKDTVNCRSCEAAINTTPNSINFSQLKLTEQEKTASQSAPNDDLNARLMKAMRRNELLTYAAAGLAVVLLAVIIIISLL